MKTTPHRTIRVLVWRPAPRGARAGRSLRLPALQGGGRRTSGPSDVARDVLVDPPDGGDALRRRRDDRDPGPPGPAPADVDARAARRGRAPEATRLRSSSSRCRRVSRPRFPLAEKPNAIKPLDPSPALDAALAKIAAELVTEFSAKGLTDEGLSIAVIDLSRDTPGGILPGRALPRRRVLLPVLGREALLPLVLRVAQAGGQARRHAGARPRRQGHDHGLLERRDGVRRRLDHRHDLRPRDLGRASGSGGRRKRNVVNDWYRGRGYTNLNANQKTFCEDAYGREQAFRDGGKNRNRMTAAEAARILKEIVHGEVAGETLTAEMLASALSRHRGGGALRGPRARGRAPGRAGPAAGQPRLGQVRRRLRLPPPRRPRGPAQRVRLRRRRLHEGREDVPEVIPRAYEKVAAHFLAPRP